MGSSLETVSNRLKSDVHVHILPRTLPVASMPFVIEDVQNSVIRNLVLTVCKFR